MYLYIKKSYTARPSKEKIVDMVTTPTLEKASFI